MRRPSFLLLYVAAAILCAPVPGQAAISPPAVEASPEARDAAVREADRLIGEADAEAFFENITDGGVAQVRHLRSGLVCGFDVGARGNSIHIFKSAIPRGDDVGCGSTVAGITVTVYATRYAEPTTAEAAMGTAYSGIRQAWTGIERYEGERISINSENLPQTYVLQLLVSDKAGRRLYTQANTAQLGDWSYLLRVTGKAEEAMPAQLLAGVTWASTLETAMKNPGSD